MVTRWRKFRYGTEETNPSWSFYTSVLCMGVMLILYGYSETSGDLSVWAYSFVFGILLLVSLAHLNMTVCNEKSCAVPVRLLDGRWPDLWLTALLGILFLSKDRFLFDYCEAVAECLYFMNYADSIIPGVMMILFLTVPFSVLLLFLLMSIARHALSGRLVNALFFVRLLRMIRKKGKKLAGRWQDYREQAARRGEPAKQWGRRRYRDIVFRTALLMGATIYIGAVCGVEHEVLPIGLLIAVLFVYQIMTEMNTAQELGIIMDEIHSMSEDAFVQDTPKIWPGSLLRVPEEELLSVQRNRRESLEKQLQSERMKVDLITNVSHDLKTPLTSMIGCIDLLKQVEGLPEEAKDYVRLLSKKAGRLREMIQDVFDMARATSGGQDLKMEQLDMTRLIRQTLADMQDRTDASGLIFRVKIDDRELPFMGDGKKLSRVYQNLIENTLKYSMAGSRVYITVREKEGKIITAIRNTSDCEMDFDAEEIISRFTRGDKSRSTEGNGLGLAIAKSFTEACRGSFRVTLDGDLFKVETEFDAL